LLSDVDFAFCENYLMPAVLCGLTHKLKENIMIL